MEQAGLVPIEVSADGKEFLFHVDEVLPISGLNRGQSQGAPNPKNLKWPMKVRLGLVMSSLFMNSGRAWVLTEPLGAACAQEEGRSTLKLSCGRWSSTGYVILQASLGAYDGWTP